MHDSRLVTLKLVVDYYNHGGVKNPFLDNRIILLKLTEFEKQNLVVMILTLNIECSMLPLCHSFWSYLLRGRIQFCRLGMPSSLFGFGVLVGWHGGESIVIYRATDGKMIQALIA